MMMSNKDTNPGAAAPPLSTGILEQLLTDVFD